MRNFVRRIRLASLVALLILAGCGTTGTPSTNESPVITGLQASALQGPAPLPVTFTVNASDPNGDALTYLWDMAGQQYPGGPSYAFTLTTAGEHSIGVTVSDGEYRVSEVITVMVDAALGDPGDPEPPMPPTPPGEPSPPAPPVEPAPPPGEPEPPVAPAPPGGTVESVIVSDFDGFEYGNIYELANGQIWEQTEFYFWFYYYFRPEVLIYPSQGQMKMKVAGIDHAVTVTRIR